MESSRELPDSLARLRWLALLFGVAGVAITTAVAFFQPELTLTAYLVAFLLVLGLSLGSMAWVMLHHLTGGRWGAPVRRFAEQAAALTPLLLVFFIPIGLSVALHKNWIFPWVDIDPHLEHHVQHAWLNPGAFLIRAAIYFAIWIGLTMLLRTWSRRRDETGDGRYSQRLRTISALGIVLYFFTMSLAAVDWVMSREIAWFSTIIGFLVVMGQVTTALCFLILVLSSVSARPPFHGLLQRNHFQDLGSLLLTCVILWTYMSFAQYLIIWLGNLSEEIPWYVRRGNGLWGGIAALLILFHFFVPFFLLLMRVVKRRVTLLATVAGLLLLMRCLDVFWMVAPTTSHSAMENIEAHAPDSYAVIQAGSSVQLGSSDTRLLERPAFAGGQAARANQNLPPPVPLPTWPHWLSPLLTVAAIVGLGGLWLAVFLFRLPGLPLLARPDPLIPMEDAHGQPHPA